MKKGTECIGIPMCREQPANGPGQLSAGRFFLIPSRFRMAALLEEQ